MMRFAVLLILGCAPLLCLGAPPKDIPTKEIPERVRQKDLPPKDIQAPDEDYDEFISEWGFIRHVPTGMIVYSENDTCSLGSALRIGHNDGKGPLEVRYVSIGVGHVGRFETRCETVIGPQRTWPGNDEPIVVTYLQFSGRHWIDEESTLLHFKYGDPTIALHYSHYGGSENPQDGAELVLKENEEEASRFQFVPNSGPITAYYPTPELSGEWFQVGEVMVTEPGTSQPYVLEYYMGRLVWGQDWSVRSWRPSPARAFDWFRESEFNYYACRSESVTWDFYLEREEAYEVSYGLSVFYQWSFIAEQNNEAIRFRSSIITVTNARDEVPEIIHVGEDHFC